MAQAFWQNGRNWIVIVTFIFLATIGATSERGIIMAFTFWPIYISGGGLLFDSYMKSRRGLGDRLDRYWRLHGRKTLIILNSVLFGPLFGLLTYKIIVTGAAFDPINFIIRKFQ